MNLNKVQLIGRVTKDPEMKTLPSGNTVVSMGMATNRTWKDKEGNKQEEADFHNLIGFGKTADTIGKYVVKGQLLYVEGRLQTRSWEGTDGKKNYKTEIIIENFQFGPRAQNGSSTERTESKEVEYDEEEINPDDIPF